MARSHRSQSTRSSPHSLIIPFALTITTAALASAGLYFFSGESSPPSSYPGSDSEHEPVRSHHQHQQQHHQHTSTSSSRRRSRRSDRVPDRLNVNVNLNTNFEASQHPVYDITEEDTDAIEESRRDEELYRIRRTRGVMGYMKGAVETFATGGGDEDGLAFEEDEGPHPARNDFRDYGRSSYYSSGAAASTSASYSAPASTSYSAPASSSYYPRPPPPGVGSYAPPKPAPPKPAPVVASKSNYKPATVSLVAASAPVVAAAVPIVATATASTATVAAAAAAAAEKTQQYTPLPRRKRPIVIVVEERKATQGHESDSDFEEALLPTRSLLSQLPRPLRLRNTDLSILIHSPHLRAPKPVKEPQLTDELTFQVPEPMEVLSPTLQAQRFHDDHNRSSYEIALDVLPLDAPTDRIRPFQSLDNLVPLIQQISPEIVYVEEAVDTDGRLVNDMLNAGVGKVVVVVGGGDGDELAGLVSSDEEGSERRRGEGKWWGESGEVRRQHGRRVEVVEMWVVEDDWRRRVQEVDAQKQ